MTPSQLYQHLPVPLQNAALSAIGLGLELGRYGRRFDAILAGYRERLSWSRSDVAAFRDRRLRRFVRHAVETTPYYRRRFAELGLAPGDIGGLADLGALPVLRKADVRAHAREIASRAVPRRGRVWRHTSGTTGASLAVPMSRDALREQRAVWCRYWALHGLERTTPSGLFLGDHNLVPPGQSRPPYWRTNRAAGQVFFSVNHLNPATVRDYVGEVRRAELGWIHGLPSALAYLAALMRDHDLSFEGCVERVTLGAENVHAHQVELIADAFGVRPRQHYGMVEGVANASEWPDGSLVIDEDFAAFELVADGRGGHEVVGTNFTNPAFPLLRYAVGDRATPGGARPAPAWGRRIESLDGRSDDYVVLADGSYVGCMDTMLHGVEHIREAQIHQREAGAITVRIVPDPGYSPADEARLRRQIARALGADRLRCGIEPVASLPRSPSGKVRFVICELAGGSIERGFAPGATRGESDD